MKILYFTSTGNCLYIAKRLGGELLSIPQLQKDGVFEITDDVVGIICPIYGFNMPHLVRRYLENAIIKAEYIFTVMTFGNRSVAALAQMKKLLGKRGVALHYSNEIKMVDNYLPGFDITDQLRIHTDENIELKINDVVNDIKERKHFLKNHTRFQKFVSNVFSSLMTKRVMNGMVKNFIVNDLCNGCGTCRKVCPMGNIAGTEKPEYQNNCEFCLACIHLCPKNAIHLKNEKSEKRFLNQHIKLSEITDANKQN
ncbi:MAG: EFR1 family ferrodoxin [Spirochaetaceae bacterium]|nr:EFR1 family ferrodoxin [Spirochaetaceae bacterium]